MSFEELLLLSFVVLKTFQLDPVSFEHISTLTTNTVFCHQAQIIWEVFFVLNYWFILKVLCILFVGLFSHFSSARPLRIFFLEPLYPVIRHFFFSARKWLNRPELMPERALGNWLREYVVRPSVTHFDIASVRRVLGSYHIFESSVINCWTEAWQHGIYLLNWWSGVTF